MAVYLANTHQCVAALSAPFRWARPTLLTPKPRFETPRRFDRSLATWALALDRAGNDQDLRAMIAKRMEQARFGQCSLQRDLAYDGGRVPGSCLTASLPRLLPHRTWRDARRAGHAHLWTPGIWEPCGQGNISAALQFLDQQLELQYSPDLLRDKATLRLMQGPRHLNNAVELMQAVRSPAGPRLVPGWSPADTPILPVAVGVQANKLCLEGWFRARQVLGASCKRSLELQLHADREMPPGVKFKRAVAPAET
jgi:hypothetical protein